MHISQLNRFPIKSCRGQALEHCELAETGLVGDRQWMVVDETGQCMTAREHHQMLAIDCRALNDGWQVSAPNMPELKLASTAEGPSSPVVLWGQDFSALDQGEAAAEWFSRFLGLPCRLVRAAGDMQRRVRAEAALDFDHTLFADAAPLLLVSEASLDALNQWLPAPVSMDRFRPNVVIAGASAFAEDDWPRVRLAGIPLRRAKLCRRCVLTTIDPVGLLADPDHEPLRTLARQRNIDGQGPCFGALFTPERGGQLHLGDRLESG